MNGYLNQYINGVSRQNQEFRRYIEQEYQIMRYQIIKAKYCIDFITNKTAATEDTKKTILGFSDYKGWNKDGVIDKGKFFEITDYYKENKKHFDNWTTFFSGIINSLRVSASQNKKFFSGYQEDFVNHLKSQIDQIFVYVEELTNAIFALGCHKSILAGFGLAPSPFSFIYSIGEARLKIDISDEYKVLGFNILDQTKLISTIISLAEDLL